MLVHSDCVTLNVIVKCRSSDAKHLGHFLLLVVAVYLDVVWNVTEWGWMTRDSLARCVKVTELSSRTDEITFIQSYKPHKGCGGVKVLSFFLFQKPH